MKSAIIAIQPRIFSGKDDDDPYLYMQHFEQVSVHNQWSPELRMQIIGSYLEGVAGDFYRFETRDYERLQGDQIKWEDFKAAFLQHGSSWVKVVKPGTLWLKREQTCNESAVSYLYYMLNLANRFNPNMKEKEMISRIIVGLQVDVYNVAHQLNPSSITELREVLERYEERQLVIREKTPDIHQMVFTVQNEIKKLEDSIPTAIQQKETPARKVHKQPLKGRQTYGKRQPKITARSYSRSPHNPYRQSKHPSQRKASSPNPVLPHPSILKEEPQTPQQPVPYPIARSSDALLHLKCKINGIVISVLIDTGSTISLIREDIARGLKIEGSPVTIRDLSGGVTHTKGKTSVRISLPDSSHTTCNMHVVAQIGYPAILGGDFLRSRRCVIDYAGPTLLEERGRKIPLIYEASQTIYHPITTCADMSSCRPVWFRVYLHHDFVIKPQSRATIECYIKWQQNDVLLHSTTTAVQLLPSEEQFKSSQLTTLPQKIQLCDMAKVLVEITNFTTKHRHVNKQLPVGVFQLHIPFTPCHTTMVINEDPPNEATPQCRENTTHKTPPTPIERKQQAFKFQLGNCLTKARQNRILRLLQNYGDVLVLPWEPLGTSTLQADPLVMKRWAKPFKLPMYDYSTTEKDEIEERLNELLAEGVIRRSASPYSSPLVLLNHQTAKPSLCVDLRAVNHQIIPSPYYLPNNNSIISTLAGNSYFSIINMEKGYHQILLADEDCSKMAFSAPNGHFEHTKLPCGLKSARCIFQKLINTVLTGLLNKICLYCLDDLIIFGADLEAMLENLQQVLARLRKYKLKAKIDKCYFAKSTLKLWGQLISSAGIKSAPANTRLLAQYGPPKNARELRSFLALCNYYRAQIPNLNTRVIPLLPVLLPKAVYVWGDQQQTALDDLRLALCTPPIVGNFDVPLPTELHVNSSPYGLGATLVQKKGDQERVIMYSSRFLTAVEQTYSNIEREYLAIIFGLLRYHTFFPRKMCTIVSCHHPLIRPWDSNSLSPRIIKWSIILQEFRFQLKHSPETSKNSAYFLSRLIEPKDYLPPIFNQTFSVSLTNFQKLQSEDKFTSKILSQIKSIKMHALLNYEIHNGVLYRSRGGKPRVFIPYILQKQLIMEAHYGPTSCHRRPGTTISSLLRQFYWDKLEQSVYKYMQTCRICQLAKRPVTPPPLPPTEYKLSPFEEIAIDFSGPHPTSGDGNRYIIICVCTYARYVICLATPDQSAKTTADFIMEYIVLRHTCPRIILTDRVLNFRDELIKHLRNSISCVNPAPCDYLPTADELFDRPTSQFKNALNSYLHTGTSNNWDRFLQLICASVNTTINEDTKQTPCSLVNPNDQPVSPI